MCVPKWKIGLLGSSYFIGWVLTLLWIPRLADIYGRTKLIQIAMIIDFILFTILLMSKSLNLSIAIMFGLRDKTADSLNCRNRLCDSKLYN